VPEFDEDVLTVDPAQLEQSVQDLLLRELGGR
jgi:hypothetical protein